MKAYIVKQADGSVHISNLPITVGLNGSGVIGKKVELTDDEFKNAVDVKTINEFDEKSGQLTFKEYVPIKSELQVQKEELIAKIEEGKATVEDLQMGMKLLLTR